MGKQQCINVKVNGLNVKVITDESEVSDEAIKRIEKWVEYVKSNYKEARKI